MKPFEGGDQDWGWGKGIMFASWAKLENSDALQEYGYWIVEYPQCHLGKLLTSLGVVSHQERMS